MAMIPVRKEREGSAAGRLADGSGWSYEWPADGAVVEVPYEVALDLLAIPHGGYSAVADDEQETAADGGEESDEARQIEEPAPDPDGGELSEDPPARRRPAKKSAAKAPVEE